MLGPMKEKELTPGTVYPVLGTLLFFLPERYREKLCCVTPLPQKVFTVHTTMHFQLQFVLIYAFNSGFALVYQPKEINTYQMATKDGSGAAYCKEDMVTEYKEAESDRARTEDEDIETRISVLSCQLTAHMVQETAL